MMKPRVCTRQVPLDIDDWLFALFHDLFSALRSSVPGCCPSAALEKRVGSVPARRHSAGQCADQMTRCGAHADELLADHTQRRSSGSSQTAVSRSVAACDGIITAPYQLPHEHGRRQRRPGQPRRQTADCYYQQCQRRRRQACFRGSRWVRRAAARGAETEERARGQRSQVRAALFQAADVLQPLQRLHLVSQRRFALLSVVFVGSFARVFVCSWTLCRGRIS